MAQTLSPGESQILISREWIRQASRPTPADLSQRHGAVIRSGPWAERLA